MKRSVFPVFLLLGLLAVQACGPIRSTVGLIRADKVLLEANEMQAQEHAPYPMTLAQALRDKAWEEQGYGAYDTAVHMAAEAETLANEAILITRAATAARVVFCVSKWVLCFGTQ